MWGKTKKIILACFLTIIMLMVPVSSALNTVKNTEQKNIYMTSEEKPEFYITSIQRDAIDNYIETNFEGTEKQEAITLIESIINSNLKVDLNELSNSLETYVYTPINETVLSEVSTMTELDNLILQYWGFNQFGFMESLFGTLLLKIVEFIKDRLGWTYDLLDKGIVLFYNSINLLIDIIKPFGLELTKKFVGLINIVLTAPIVFYEALRSIFELEDQTFFQILDNYVNNFASKTSTFINFITSFVQNPTLLDYFNQIDDFNTWLNQKHWEDSIHVTGSVKKFLVEGYAGLTITCRGQTTVTDSNGEYELFVDPMPDEDSYPQNEYYGIHNCQITVTKNDEIIKQSNELLSYSFSGGKIQKNFIVTQSLIVTLLEKIIDIFPFLEPILQPIIDQFQT